MQTMEIFFSDLCPSAQAEYVRHFGHDDNVEDDCFPVAIIDRGDDDDDSDEGLLIWRLDGNEVARSYGAEAAHYVSNDSGYLFPPYRGRNVQTYLTNYSTVQTETYEPDGTRSID